MPRTTRCPKCGFMQLAQASCRKCGVPISPPSIPPPAAPARRVASPPPPALDVEDSPYQPPATSASRSPRAASMESSDEVFDRDRFLLRQRVLTIHEKYEV
ncbi:MAG TPA: hypothetical protein VIB78_11900, partial [Acidimicrobiia bacterium]